ncbi:hypothetical protein QW131_02450 [Roseibium salinum]|nr:hypothetical protein [Roseibium salinum]
MLAIAVAGLLTGAPADAGLLSRLAREAGDAAGSAGKHVDGAAGLVDEGVSLARKLPHAAEGTGVALLPGEGNAWQLVTSDGKSLPIASLDDIGQGLEDAAHATHRPLAGDKTPARRQGGGSFQIAIRETDFFKLRDQLHALPANARPVMIRPNGRSYPLKPVGSGARSRLAVELGPDVLINPASRRALGGNIRFLSRPVNRSNLKLARFDSAAAQGAAPDGLIVDLNADILESSLAKFKNRTLVVSGRIVRSPETGQAQLVVRDGGTIRNIDVETFHGAAERQRVNLMIVESTTPVQPGKSWFSRTAIERRLADAQAAMTQADLMAALSPPRTPPP